MRVNWHPWGLHILFRRGVEVSIHPTQRCNLRCPYCIVDAVTGKRPVFQKELTPAEWLRRLERFPAPIKQINLSGGEPTVYKALPELLSGLLERYPVQMFTNLTQTFPIYGNRSRLRIRATYHPVFSLDKFNRNVDFFRKAGIDLVVREVDVHPKYIRNSETKEECNPHNMNHKFIFCPNGVLTTACEEVSWRADNSPDPNHVPL